MSGRSISHVSADPLTTQQTNVTGELTSILDVDPVNGTFIKLKNRFPRGAAPGIPVIMKLRSAAATPLPTDTTVVLRVDRPTDDVPVAVSVRENNISPWNDQSLTDQRDEEHIDSVKLELKSQAVNVTYHDTLSFEVNASAAISWSDSELYFPRDAIEEHDLE